MNVLIASIIKHRPELKSLRDQACLQDDLGMAQVCSRLIAAMDHAEIMLPKPVPKAPLCRQCSTRFKTNRLLERSLALPIL